MITQELVQQRVKTLPSLPTTVVSLGRAVADERCNVDRILGILAKDPALSATMLRLANSVMYAGDNPVKDMRTAVMRLGFDAVLNLGRCAAVIRSYRSASHLDAVRLWQHSVAVGIVAKGICRLLRRNAQEEDAFLCGLLHDIGKIALDHCFAEDYGPVVQAVAEGEHAVDAEARILGITHAEVGGIVAMQWRFPEHLVEIISSHHDPIPGNFLSNLVNLTDLLVRTRIPNGPADETLALVLTELPAFQEVFGRIASTSDLDLERLTFGIDDELDHAVTFVKLAYQD